MQTHTTNLKFPTLGCPAKNVMYFIPVRKKTVSTHPMIDLNLFVKTKLADIAYCGKKLYF